MKNQTNITVIKNNVLGTDIKTMLSTFLPDAASNALTMSRTE